MLTLEMPRAWHAQCLTFPLPSGKSLHADVMATPQGGPVNMFPLPSGKSLHADVAIRFGVYDQRLVSIALRQISSC